VLEVLYHHAKFGGALISPSAGVAKDEFCCRLFVCLFVRHAFERQKLCARFRHEGVGVQKVTILMPLDRGRFVVVHPPSSFSDCCQMSTPLNAEVQKRQNWGLTPPEGAE